MAARMEQCSNSRGLRVNARQICPFMKITVDARESQVAELIATAVSTRHNVLHVEPSER